MINSLINDDCFNVFPKIANNSIDLILCDLPYNTTACYWDSILPLDKLWIEYIRIIKDTGSIILTASQPFTTKLISSNFEMFRFEMIWQKSRSMGFHHSANMPLKNHESILIFSKAKIKHKGQSNRMTYNPQGLKIFNKLVNGDKSCKADFNGHNFSRKSTKNNKYIQKYTNYPTSILKIPSEGKILHPTQKSVELFEYLIRTFSNDNAIVLDNCAGVATTAIACINTNRNYICIEKDEKYYQIGLDRIKKIS